MLIISSLFGNSVSTQRAEMLDPSLNLRLPADIIYRIFSKLLFKDFWNCGQVCKEWRAIASDSTLWNKRSRMQKIPLSNKLYFLKKQYFFAKQKKIHIDKIKDENFHKDTSRFCIFQNFLFAETNSSELKTYDINTNNFSNQTLSLTFTKRLKIEVVDSKRNETFKVLCCKVSRYAVMCFADGGNIFIYDRYVKKVISQFQPNQGLRLVEIFDKVMVELFDSNLVRSFDKYTYKCTGESLIEGKISSFTAASKQNLLIAGFENGNLKVWEAETLTALYDVCGHTKKVAALSVGGSALASGSIDGDVKLWKLYQNKITLAKAHNFNFAIQCLVLHHHMVFCGGPKSLAIWNLISGQTKIYKVGESVQSISLVKSNIILRVPSGFQIWKFQKN